MVHANVERIANFLKREFASLIDLTDVAHLSAAQQESHLLSRSLAALCIRALAETDMAAAADAVTDGYGDGGIDAMYYDHARGILYFVQSKWTPRKAPESDEIASFIDGVELLMAGNTASFGKKVRKKDPMLWLAFSTRYRVMLVTVCPSTQRLSKHARNKFDHCLTRLNDPDPIADSEHYNQSAILNMIRHVTAPPKISLDITLRDWGLITHPYRAYYGRATLSLVSKWWHDYKSDVLGRNIRKFLHDTKVNDQLKNTLHRERQNFWYFNNGLTVTCRKIDIRGPRNDREINVFHCEDVSIVNGAQTIGAIGTVVSTDDDETDAIPRGLPNNGNSVSEGWVQVRIISLDDCPDGFDDRVTRATNFQNAVTAREFASMDPAQHRLAAEFALDRRRYAYRTGDEPPHGPEGCDMQEATQALACASGKLDLAVQVKREISVLWENTQAPPYTDLFNRSATAITVWRAVCIMRVVDEELTSFRQDNSRAVAVSVHLNRVILYLVFQEQSVRVFRSSEVSLEAVLVSARQATQRIFPTVMAYVDAQHASDYLQSLAKNRQKCAMLVDGLSRSRPFTLTPDSITLMQGELFE